MPRRHFRIVIVRGLEIHHSLWITYILAKRNRNGRFGTTCKIPLFYHYYLQKFETLINKYAGDRYQYNQFTHTKWKGPNGEPHGCSSLPCGRLHCLHYHSSGFSVYWAVLCILQKGQEQHLGGLPPGWQRHGSPASGHFHVRLCCVSEYIPRSPSRNVCIRSSLPAFSGQYPHRSHLVCHPVCTCLLWNQNDQYE